MMMVGRARDMYEQWEEDMTDDDETSWRKLVNRVQDYATRRRLEATVKNRSGMDVDEVGENGWARQPGISVVGKLL